MDETERIPNRDISSDQASSANSGAPLNGDPAFEVNEKELLDSYSEILKEFAKELKEIEDHGVFGDEAVVDEKHETFLRENWTMTAGNLRALFGKAWKEKKYAGAKEASLFVLKHIIKKSKTFSRDAHDRLKPALEMWAEDFKEWLKKAPGRFRTWVTCTDPAMWIQRTKKGAPIWGSGLIITLFAANYSRLFPPEQYADIEDLVSIPEPVDLKDKKRIVNHLLSLPPILIDLKQGKTRYRLLQVDMSVECDSVLTVAEMNSETLLSEIRDSVAATIGKYRFEDLNTPAKKEKAKKEIVAVIQKLAPKNSRIYTVYTTKWIFAPNPGQKPR